MHQGSPPLLQQANLATQKNARVAATEVCDISLINKHLNHFPHWHDIKYRIVVLCKIQIAQSYPTAESFLHHRAKCSCSSYLCCTMGHRFRFLPTLLPRNHKNAEVAAAVAWGQVLHIWTSSHIAMISSIVLWCLQRSKLYNDMLLLHRFLHNGA